MEAMSREEVTEDCAVGRLLEVSEGREGGREGGRDGKWKIYEIGYIFSLSFSFVLKWKRSTATEIFHPYVSKPDFFIHSRWCFSICSLPLPPSPLSSFPPSSPSSMALRYQMSTSRVFLWEREKERKEEGEEEEW